MDTVLATVSKNIQASLAILVEAVPQPSLGLPESVFFLQIQEVYRKYIDDISGVKGT
jgi:hypothetical protein